MDLFERWLGVLNFYLIVASGGELNSTDFRESRLRAAFRVSPEQSNACMDRLATKLVLEFQAKAENTEVENSPMAFLPPVSHGGTGLPSVVVGENQLFPLMGEEIPNASVSIPLPGLSSYV